MNTLRKVGLSVFILLLSAMPLTAQEGASYPGPVSLSGLFYLAYQKGEEGG